VRSALILQLFEACLPQTRLGLVMSMHNLLVIPLCILGIISSACGPKQTAADKGTLQRIGGLRLSDASAAIAFIEKTSGLPTSFSLESVSEQRKMIRLSEDLKTGADKMMVVEIDNHGNWSTSRNLDGTWSHTMDSKGRAVLASCMATLSSKYSDGALREIDVNLANSTLSIYLEDYPAKPGAHRTITFDGRGNIVRLSGGR
jgi:hypothetical protein